MSQPVEKHGHHGSDGPTAKSVPNETPKRWNLVNAQHQVNAQGDLETPVNVNLAANSAPKSDLYKSQEARVEQTSNVAALRDLIGEYNDRIDDLESEKSGLEVEKSKQNRVIKSKQAPPDQKELATNKIAEISQAIENIEQETRDYEALIELVEDKLEAPDIKSEAEKLRAQEYISAEEMRVKAQVLEAYKRLPPESTHDPDVIADFVADIAGKIIFKEVANLRVDFELFKAKTEQDLKNPASQKPAPEPAPLEPITGESQLPIQKRESLPIVNRPKNALVEVVHIDDPSGRQLMESLQRALKGERIAIILGDGEITPGNFDRVLSKLKPEQIATLDLLIGDSDKKDLLHTLRVNYALMKGEKPVNIFSENVFAEQFRRLGVRGQLLTLGVTTREFPLAKAEALAKSDNPLVTPFEVKMLARIIKAAQRLDMPVATQIVDSAGLELPEEKWKKYENSEVVGMAQAAKEWIRTIAATIDLKMIKDPKFRENMQGALKVKDTTPEPVRPITTQVLQPTEAIPTPIKPDAQERRANINYGDETKRIIDSVVDGTPVGEAILKGISIFRNAAGQLDRAKVEDTIRAMHESAAATSAPTSEPVVKMSQDRLFDLLEEAGKSSNSKDYITSKLNDPKNKDLLYGLLSVMLDTNHDTESNKSAILLDLAIELT